MAGTFCKNFDLYRENPIAIYGLGEATKEILGQAGGKFHIVGLLDGCRREGEMYGLPILPLEELPGKGVLLVVIAARPSSRRIIRKRIQGFCRQHDIMLFDPDGNRLLDGNASLQGRPMQVQGADRDWLLGQIDSSEAVSFDIFDTLLTRQILCPEDVFKLVQKKIPKEWQISGSFCRERELAERELSRNDVPTWDEIYQYMAGRNNLSPRQVGLLKQLEVEVEESVLIRREEVCQLLQYAINQGKKVYLVSDMYFSERQLVRLLEKNNVTGYAKIFVSCEYGITKGRGLFRHLLGAAGTMSVLHIGDSQEADVDGAKRYGIKGVKIPGPLEQMEQSGLLERLDAGSPGKGSGDALEREVKLGMLAARLFNSPFQTEGHALELSEPSDVGYLLFAPALTDFTLWLWHRVRENGEKTVLFGARDGYLVKQLFDELQIRQGSQTDSVYFLTSRLCASLAGIYSRQDIDYVAGLSFDGSFEQMLRTRFLLTKEEFSPERRLAEDYWQVILGRAMEKRKHYQTYIRKLGLKSGSKAFFDFVSTGTCQAALQRIMGEELQGYYFMRLEGDCAEKREMKAEGFYAPEEAEDIYEDYFLLENILTSLSPSLQSFDVNGSPQYLKEDRTEAEIAFIDKVHKGIKEYFRRYLEICGVEEMEGDREFSGRILHLLHSIPVANETFQALQWTDAFYGRKEKVADMA